MLLLTPRNEQHEFAPPNPRRVGTPGYRGQRTPVQDTAPPGFKCCHGLRVTAELRNRLESAPPRDSFVQDVLEENEEELSDVIEAGPKLNDEGRRGCDQTQ